MTLSLSLLTWFISIPADTLCVKTKRIFKILECLGQSVELITQPEIRKLYKHKRCTNNTTLKQRDMYLFPLHLTDSIVSITFNSPVLMYIFPSVLVYPSVNTVEQEMITLTYQLLKEPEACLVMESTCGIEEEEHHKAEESQGNCV